MGSYPIALGSFAPTASSPASISTMSFRIPWPIARRSVWKRPEWIYIHERSLVAERGEKVSEGVSTSWDVYSACMSVVTTLIPPEMYASWRSLLIMWPSYAKEKV